MSSAGHAQEQTVVSFITPAASAPAGNLADYGVGFELFPPDQMYWWSGWGVGGEIPENSQIGFNIAAQNAFPFVPILSENYLITGAAMDPEYVYFADNKSRQIYHSVLWGPTNAGVNAISTPFTPPASGYNFGAVMFWNGLFYWSDYNGTSWDVYSFSPTNSSTQYVWLGSGNKLVKMVGFTYNTSPFTYTDAIFALTADGTLVRMDINPQGTFDVVLATNVTDFAIRDESEFHPPFSFSFFTTVYAATGQTTSVNGSTPPGTLLAINADTGAASTIYTASGQDQITSVAVDTTNIYWTEQPVTCNPPFGCILGDYSIYRQSRPQDYSTSPGPVNLIGLPGGGAGLNLRSDGQWLYFINGTTIKRLSTGTPAVQLDVEADGLEVVQAIQNLDSQIPLVADHATYVRGYAHVNAYTSKTWYTTALLHGFRNGVELPGSPIFPVSDPPLLSGFVQAPQLRGDTQHTFLFQLPASWVQSGADLPAQLNFTMTVNPFLEIPETFPPTNNTVSLLQPATLQAGLTPCLVTVPLISKEGAIYYYYSGGFEQIFQRVLSLLPADHLDLHPYLVTDPFGDWNNPYDFGNTNSDTSIGAWGGALDDLEFQLLFWDPFPGNNDLHLIGMVASAALSPGSSLAGISHRPGHVVVTDMDPTFGRGHSAQGGMITTHELGHNYGRKHIDCGNFPPDQADFDIVTYPCDLGNPNTNLVTSTFGYDPIDNTAVPPNTASDLMTYSSPAWVSAYNWDSNLGVPPLSNIQPGPVLATGSRPAPQTGSDLVMAVSGTVNLELSAAALGAFYIIPQSAAPAAVLAESRVESDQAAGQSNSVYVVFLDSNGNLLSQVAVALEDTEGNNFSLLYFSQYVDVPLGARSIQLVQGSQVLAVRYISPDAPTVALNPPVIDPVAETLQLNWTANDPDGNPLLFTIQYSSDNGTSWRALRANYPYLGITFGTSLLPGGPQCLLRVIATDGANTAISMTSPFPMPLQPPIPFIEGVNEQQRLNFNSGAQLRGVAVDAQYGTASNLLFWVLSGPTPLNSTASTLSLNSLSPGNYTAKLTATNGGGMTASAVRDFQVLPPTIPDGAASAFDGMGDTGGYTNSLYIPLPLEDGSLASIRMFHVPGLLYVGFYHLKFGSGTPRSVGLMTDPTATPSAAPGTNDFGFFVDEHGAPSELQGNGTTFVFATNPPPGFATAIYRGSNAWSAEITIPESQLGGWGHLGSMMIKHGPVQWPLTAVTNQPPTWATVFLGTNAPASPNLPPVANAGTSFSVSLTNTQTLSLDGTASFDPNGDTLTYAWTQIGGQAVTLTGVNTATPSFAAAPVTSVTNLTFQLVVNDGSFNSTPSQVQVALLPPPARPAFTAPASSVTLRGDGTLQLQLVGIPTQAYQIQASSNLVSWVNLNTVYADYAGRIAFLESSDRTNYPVRFYRGIGQ